MSEKSFLLFKFYKKKKKTIFAESYRYSSYIFQIFNKINVRFCREMKEEKKRKGLWNESLVILKQRTCFPDTQDFFSAVWIDDLPFFIRLIRILRTILRTRFIKWNFDISFFNFSRYRFGQLLFYFRIDVNIGELLRAFYCHFQDAI